MATPKSCFELVTDNVEATLKNIQRLNGHTNTLEVHRESQFGLGPSPIDPTDRYVYLVPGEITYHANYSDGSGGHMSPMNADDYTMVFWLDCYGYEPKDGSMSHDAVGQSIAADIIKELNIGYQRGTHPDSGRQLALNTKIRFATPMELQQSQHRGIVLRAEVLVRTALSDPFNLP